MNDLKLDIEGDLAVEKGDLIIGESSSDIIKSVLLAVRGEFKEDPEIGANVRNCLNGSMHPFWTQDTKKMLQKSGLPVQSIKIENNEILIN